jgi:subtilisin family serine protease
MKSKGAKLVVWLVFVALLTATPLAIAAPAPVPAPDGLAPFDPYILTVIDAEGQADFYVVLKTQADLSAADSLPTKEAKGQYVYDALTEVAAKTQGPILSALRAEGATFDPFWIRNMVRVRGADKALLLEMAARPDVAEIFYEYAPVLDVDSASTAKAVPETVEWNIARVNADDVWGLGITGTGAVVGDLDTGVQWDHPALINSYRGNLGGGTYDHNYNWFDGIGGSAVPQDYDTHGTHTMGTIVGDDGAGNQIGMAPGARWIACPGIGSPNVGAMDCFQWFLAPTKLDGTDPRPDLAPDVINNSWSSAGTDYHAIIQTLTAAGIFYAKSAGNEGSGCGTITNPGQWPEVTAAAAFAQGDTIASFSSRGPVIIGHDTFIKPDIAAPGVNVRSSLPGDTYGNYQGTSMACPHVTGAVALLISARPDLAGQVDILQMLLKQTAEPKISAQCPPYVDHPNDVWGWGILNIYDAVLAAQALGLGGIEGQVTDSSTLAPVADAAITFTDTTTAWALTDVSDASGEYSRTLPAATYDVSAFTYGYLPSLDTGIAVADGATTTLNISLDPAPVWTVVGTVTETQTGDPLAAHIRFEETPISADTDPLTGDYSAGVAQGTWWLEATSPGHAKEYRQVAVDQDLTEDFSLLAVDNYYMKTNANICGPAFTWLDASGGTAHCLSDDSSKYVALPTGRTFTFYNNTYNALYLGSNGHVTFGAGDSKWSGPIPDPATPNNGIYAFDTDLNPNNCSQGTIYTDLLDDRYFVIEFDQIEHYPNGNPETFEIILDLDSGKVSILLQTISDPTGVVVGVENSTGTEATQYAYNDPALIADNVAIDFYPVFGTPPPTGDPGDIEGTVTDASTGDPIAGALVEALAFTGGETFTFTTDALGFYSGTLCADWYSMTATVVGYNPDEVATAVYSGALTTQDFELEPMQSTEADTWITKTVPTTAMPGDYLTYTLVFGSLGPDVVPWGEVYDPLPEGVVYITSTGESFYEPSEHAVMWELFDVPAGFVDTQTLVVQVSSTVTVGLELCNQAGFNAINEGAPADPDPGNNMAWACTTVEAPPPYHYIYLPLVVKDNAP